MEKPNYYVIRSNTETDKKTGEPLFWSKNGWVNIELAEKYIDFTNNENILNSSIVNIKNALNDIYVFRRNEFLNSLPTPNTQ